MAQHVFKKFPFESDHYAEIFVYNLNSLGWMEVVPKPL